MDRISSNRTNLVEENIRFAQDMSKKIKSINQKCDEILNKNNTVMNEKMSILLEQLRSFNDETLNNLKKKMNEEENQDILCTKQKIQEIFSKIDKQLISIISDILKRVYSIEPDEKKIIELYNNSKHNIYHY